LTSAAPGTPGEVYNVGAAATARTGRRRRHTPRLENNATSSSRRDRPGHDRRYALDFAKIRALGWSPHHDFTACMEETVRWYVDNRGWWEKIKSGAFREYYQKQYGARLASARVNPT
jgi:dTDP-glucose 4,6-dehydratase